MNRNITRVFLGLLLLSFCRVQAMSTARSKYSFVEKADFREAFFHKRALAFCYVHHLVPKELRTATVVCFYEELRKLCDQCAYSLIFKNSSYKQQSDTLFLVFPTHVQFCVYRKEHTLLFLRFAQWNKENYSAILRDLVKCYADDKLLDVEQDAELQKVTQCEFEARINACLPDELSLAILQVGDTLQFALEVMRFLADQVPPREFKDEDAHDSEKDV